MCSSRSPSGRTIHCSRWPTLFSLRTLPRARWTRSRRRCKPSLPICSVACAASLFTTGSCDADALRSGRRGFALTPTREDAMRKMTVVVGLVFAFLVSLVGSSRAAQLTWWSHWATQDTKKEVLNEVKRRFEAAHPGTTVALTYYEKANMWPTLRAAFTAGSGFPDVFYYDSDVPEFIGAGWLADLSQRVRWENIEPYGKAFWTRPGVGGKVGT